MDALVTVLVIAAILGAWTGCALASARLFRWSGRKWVHGLALGGFLHVLGLVIALALAGRTWLDRSATTTGIGTAQITTPESHSDTAASPFRLQLFSPRDRNYFLAGLVVLGGGIALPLMVGVIDRTAYLDSLPASLTSCALLAVVLRGNGTVSWWRATVVTIATVVLYQQAFGSLPSMPGLLRTALVLVFCGYVGAAVGGFVAELAQPSKK